MNETVGLEAWPLYCHCQRVLHKFEFQGRVQPAWDRANFPTALSFQVNA